MKMMKGFALASAAVLLASGAQAASIVGLYATGVDDSGTVLTNGAAEQHYSIVAGTTAAPRVLTSANGFPVGPWLGDNTTSAWIAPSGNSDGSAAEGNYTYRLSFSLDGLDASTASISGLWSTDDSGLDILINGVSTGSTAAGFSNFYDFSINSGFVAGLNTLDFVLNNGGGPTGLRVELSGTADVAAVPEPASWAMMVGGFGLVGAAMRRRKTAIRFA